MDYTKYDFNYAYAQLRVKNYKVALPLLHDLAKNDNTQAIYRLAKCCSEGNGVDLDHEKATYWYAQAIKLGNSEACVDLGYHYEHGLGVSKDVTRALELYEQAVQLNNSPSAHFNLGEYYQSTADWSRAFKSYLSALKNNHPRALKKALGLPLRMIPKLLHSTDASGDNLLHIAIKSDVFKLIPKNLILKDLLIQKNHAGDSPIDLLNMNHGRESLPKEYSHLEKSTDINNSASSQSAENVHDFDEISIVKKNSTAYDKDSRELNLSAIQDLPPQKVFSLIVSGLNDRSFKPAPEDYLSFDLLNKELFVNNTRSTIIHGIAQKGLFFKLSRKLPLTKELITIRDSQGNTPLHHAVEFRSFSEFPNRLKTPSILLLRNTSGISVLDNALAHNQKHLFHAELLYLSTFYNEQYFDAISTKIDINKIPEPFDFSEPLIDGNSALHILAKKNLLHLIDESCLKKYDLYQKNNQEKSIIQIAAEHGEASLLSESLLIESEDYLSKIVIHSIQNKSVSSLSPQQLDKIDFSIPVANLPQRASYYHLAAKHGELGKLYHMAPSAPALQLADKSGATALHYAAYTKAWGGLDKDTLEFILTDTPDATKRNLADHAFDKKTLSNPIGDPLKKFSAKYLLQLCSNLIESGDLQNLDSSLVDYIPWTSTIPSHSKGYTIIHLAASHGQIEQAISIFNISPLENFKDSKGNTPLHYAAMTDALNCLKIEWINLDEEITRNRKKETFLDIAAKRAEWSQIPTATLTSIFKLLTEEQKIILADTAYDHDNLVPQAQEIKYYSSSFCSDALNSTFKDNYLEAHTFWKNYCSLRITEDEFKGQQLAFVKNWAETYLTIEPDKPFLLDDQQAVSVAIHSAHIQTVARAGSGKTRTLVTRILFQILHCKIPPNSILALAFNKKAAAEIRERLSEHLPSSEMPHVMTFHALAWRIVQPNSDILYDPDGHDSKKKLSQTIERIIDKRFLTSETTASLQRIMGIQWKESLASIIHTCLTSGEIDKELETRELKEDRALDCRRVDSDVDKWVYNYLLWNNIDFNYNAPLHYHGGDVHKASFLIKRSGQKDLVIQTQQLSGKNTATTAFQQSSKTESFEIKILNISQPKNRNSIHKELKELLKVAHIAIGPLSKEKLWEKIKGDQIKEFTKSALQFITRCQKELLWPDQLERAIQSYNNPEEIQQLFWNEALAIYRDYEDELARTEQTDFDRLLLSAATTIERGLSRFSTGDKRTPGEIKNIKHLLIDEFQDFSHLFDRLRASILKATPDVKFFCVGDDWQAINRFAGSNVDYFHSFPKNFPNVTTIGLHTNYRSSSSIVDEGNKVMLGMGDPSRTHKEQTGQIYQALVTDLANLTAEEEILLDSTSVMACHIMRIAQSDGMPLAYLRAPEAARNSKRKVTILSRHTYIDGLTLAQLQEKLRTHLPDEAKQQIECSTSHGYKGQEADTVILLSPEKYPVVHPDSIFSTIFGENLHELEMDERRLFYVAVTRAESNLIYLREKDDNPCLFVPAINTLKALNLNQVQPLLLSGDKALIEVKNLVSISDINRFGTIPLKDEIKADFKWKPDKKAWVKSVASEQAQISKSVTELLSKFPWYRKIAQVEIKVSTNTLTYRYELNKGTFKRLDASLTNAQHEELDLLKEVIGESLAEAIEAILLDLKQDWPEFGYEDETGNLLEVAWLENKVGLYFPGDNIESFKKEGWRLIEISSELSDNWEKSLLPYFNSKASARVLNEGIHALYHFTDVSNIESIDTHGILSLKQLQKEEVSFTPGGNELSHQLDQDNKLDDYVHLCLTPHHPMAHQAQDRGSISEPRFLSISPNVLDHPGVKACMKVSVAKEAEIIPLETALSQINWADWVSYWNDHSVTGLEDFADNPMFKIEILIPQTISESFIQRAAH